MLRSFEIASDLSLLYMQELEKQQNSINLGTGDVNLEL